MASDRFLIWFVALSLFFTFTRAEGIVWRRLSAFFIAVTIICVAFFGEVAIYFIAPIWFGVLLLPRVALWQLRRSFVSEDWSLAALCTQVLSSLYPSDEWLAVGKLVSAHTEVQKGDRNLAEEQLRGVRLSAAFLARHPFLEEHLRGRAPTHISEQRKWRSISLTYVLIGIHAVAFVLQQGLDAAAGEQFSIYYGGLSTSLMIVGEEYWRMASSIFLHAGFIHFASNMFGLYVLGPFVERSLGASRYLFGYFASGLGSSLFIVLLTLEGLIPDAFSIGASGAVLSLVGSTAAILIYAYLKHKHVGALQQLKSVALILLIQTGFDLTTPQVSFAAHAGGVISGVVITSLMLWIRPARAAKSSG